MRRRVAFGCDDDAEERRMTTPLPPDARASPRHVVCREWQPLRVELPAEEVDACPRATPSG